MEFGGISVSASETLEMPSYSCYKSRQLHSSVQFFFSFKTENRKTKVLKTKTITEEKKTQQVFTFPDRFLVFFVVFFFCHEDSSTSLGGLQRNFLSDSCKYIPKN